MNGRAGERRGLLCRSPVEIGPLARGGTAESRKVEWWAKGSIANCQGNHIRGLTPGGG